MRLAADAKDLPDALDFLNMVLGFMNEAICGAREIPLEEEHLWGAQFVFKALEADLEEARSMAVRLTGNNSGIIAGRDVVINMGKPRS